MGIGGPPPPVEPLGGPNIAPPFGQVHPRA